LVHDEERLMPEDLQHLADVLAEADASYDADLAELEAAEVDESFRDAWAEYPEPDPDTDGKDHD
jgi:hypothetical protein